MRPRLLDLLRCPDCQENGLVLRAFAVGSGSGRDRILEGEIRCPACGSAFPVIKGVPRVLPADLRCCLATFHPEFFGRHPQARPPACRHPARDPRARTLAGFSYQHIRLQDRERELERWRHTFLDSVRVPPAFFAGKRGLDVGCGAGRHLYWAAEFGAEMVGLDLSEGVELAAAVTERSPRVDVVQGDLHRLPLRDGAFDFAHSIGVLHHLPDPRQGFRSVLPALRPGGHILIWVYGLRGMRRWYRLSHLTWLRAVARRLPIPANLVLSGAIAGLLEATLWMPSRVLAAVPATRGLARRVPLADSAHRPFRTKVRNVFDRVNPPLTHYHTAEEIRRWCLDSGLEDVEITNRDGRGWAAIARTGAIAAKSA
jgi:SAM-dependent methyltransferase